ncbi:MAG: cation-translocating P-type ATPase [Synergistaceae bacterium]|nr:cation-translocating P-type ATPase [Synergistaceae bacterium]
MTEIAEKYSGLSDAEVRERRERYGMNVIAEEKRESALKKALKSFSEPVFLLLIGAACLYFFLGEPRDGAVMLVFVAFMGAINIYQEWKTDRTLAALKSLSSPKVTVVRGGEARAVSSEELVPGDIVIISEGERISADGELLENDGFGADESTLTGEADIVWKRCATACESGRGWRADRCYAGTNAVAGRAIVRVTETGGRTEYGKIGAAVAQAPDRPTPLEKQTRRLVRDCSFFSMLMLIFVVAATCYRGGGFIEAALSGVTIAMATIPEEFPVVLTVFLALGAWRLAKRNSLIRRIPSVETLGAVTVLCVDKTGTLTENRMTLKSFTPLCGSSPRKLTEVAVLASETNPYDPMERAILDEASKNRIEIKLLQGQRLLHEFPFSSESRMMCHVWSHRGKIAAAAKGSPESVFPLCGLSEEELEEAELAQRRLAEAGCRVLAVAYNDDMREIPREISACSFKLAGLAAFIDPPRENVAESIRACGSAGVRVVMITGDNSVTAHRLAHEVGLGCGEGEHVMISGEELERMTDCELAERLGDVTIFSRILPREKMRIVKALRSRGEVVAMTGDGVNDAPALKYADIGIAMGGRGTEVAREAADMVLLDDDFSTIVSTIRDGRRIYDNIRKAMEYILVIHIPIALSALAAPLLALPALLLPVHVVLLELIIDPTCSIIFERQPEERDIMERPPRSASAPIITRGLFGKALAQGLAIFAAAFGSYYAALQHGGAEHARTFFLTVLVLANLFLVYVNRSDKDFAFKKGSAAADMIAWLVNIGVLLCLVVMSTLPHAAAATKLSQLSAADFALALLTAACATFWWEAVKWRGRVKERGAILR